MKPPGLKRPLGAGIKNAVRIIPTARPTDLPGFGQEHLTLESTRKQKGRQNRPYLFLKHGAPGRNRTYDPLIRSQMLYPLSYRRAKTYLSIAIDILPHFCEVLQLSRLVSGTVRCAYIGLLSPKLRPANQKRHGNNRRGGAD